MNYANGGDYDEFENDEKDQKSMQEEFMLRPNFSDDPEDQWDIVSFFDQNEKFQKFKPILLLQMQIQNAVHNNDDGMGNHNDQLDHLLDSMLNPNDRNESSSESDDEDFDIEPDSNSFRDYINTGYMPSSASLVYDVILSEYTFESHSFRDMKEETCPFYASIDYARPKMITADSIDSDSKGEHFMSIALRCNVPKDTITRERLNCVVILDTSSSMRNEYGGSSRSRQSVANQVVCDILDLLEDDDQFCLISFSENAKMEEPLDDIKSMDIASIQSNIKQIGSSSGGLDFDEGYNAALNQLQELFDAQIMAAANLEEDDEKEDTTENRFIFVTGNVPEADSSILDLMAVYSDSDENKIYTTFFNIGDEPASSKLTAAICKMRGCNIRNYEASTFSEDFERVLHPVFFNVHLAVNGLATDTIYGFHNSMKRINKLSQQGSVRTVKTVYLEGQMEDEVVTIRLQPEEDEDEDIGFEVELKYEGRDGKNMDMEWRMELGKIKEGQEDEHGYFDHQDVRKRIALIKWTELLAEWMAKDRKDDGSSHLNVSPEYKQKFQTFMTWFEAQRKAIGDDKMLREVEIMQSLIDFDEEKAAKARG